MQPGVYEQIVNLLIEKKIKPMLERVHTDSLDAADSHDYLAQYVYRILQKGLAQVKPAPGSKSETEKLASKLNAQVNICNEIISSLKSAGIHGLEEHNISPDAKRLLAVLTNTPPIVTWPTRPDTPLAIGSLLTGTRQDPSLVSQLKKEIVSADQIDILCSFIKWSGIRILDPALRLFTARNGTFLRVITTSYMGATDLKAVQFLASLPNTEIKVSYDTHRTRLHAKAYLLHRNTGFSSAYIGSANISQAALTDGLEWTVKVSQYEQPFQWNKISATFETYWNDREFESYSDCDEKRLQQSLTEEACATQSDTFVMPNFDLRPYPFQREILDRIAAERQLQDRKKHLVVAATGTGKTMIAAFDFKAWRETKFASGIAQNPRLLFVAHREEILKQSLYTFRAVLRDHNFGNLMVGGSRPENTDHLFISIQTYNSQNLHDIVSREHYDYIVVDEFHHAAAPSYQRLLSHINPDSLLGLTATPERMDGLDIKQYFDDHITAEIRLPDAINRKLLCPFQYFGISDSVDYSGLKWQRGGYVLSDLENVLTGNDIRAGLVIEKTAQTVLDIRQVRGLGFCVSKRHAEYMAKQFNSAGIPSEYLTADSPREHRYTVQRRLCEKAINFIFVVDLYSEGVDIPEVDTVLFLRPTESLTVFLQQLGRGLRLHDSKECLTVLDFVGQTHRKFRFDLRFTALLSDKHRNLKDELDNGFAHLPAGCSIQLEKQATQYILDNIKQSLLQSKPRIVQNIANFLSDTGLPLTLQHFLDYHHLELDDIYRRGCWSRLCASAGVIPQFADPDEDVLSKGFRRLHHINALEQINVIVKCLTNVAQESDLCELDRIRLLMFHFTLWGTRNFPHTIREGLTRLDRNPTLKSELLQLLAIRKNSLSNVPKGSALPFVCPLQLHAEYTRDEILTALGHFTLQAQPEMREGVLHLPHLKADAFFVTLNKAEKHYSPTTMYEDYAISETLFHWQSQSTTSDSSPTGQRYINHRKMGYTVLLFVREDKTQSGLTSPYHFLGAADYVKHSGSRPMSIVWRLHQPIVAHLLRKTSRLVVG